MSLQKSGNNNNVFCYRCGLITFKSQRRTITVFPLLWCPVGDQDKTWACHVCCSTCAVDLRVCITGTIDAMPFAVSGVWKETNVHVYDGYFCLNPVSGHTSKSKHIICYLNLSSAFR
jgi:hypothetical protein